MSSSPIIGQLRQTTPRTGPRVPATHAYSTLLKQVRDAGLLDRTIGFYTITFSVLVVALAGTVTGFILLGDSWFQLLIAAAFGIILTQFAFLTHEISHRQVFASGPVNDRVGRILAAGLVGISYSWWMNKHSRHHVHPNTIGKDPDIEIDTISFIEEDAAKQRGFLRMLTRKQGYLFFPLLTLEGINLHMISIKSLIAVKETPGRISELSMIAVRLVAYVAVIFWLLPIGMAFAFLAVQVAVFGVYMGASFAPNHKGMPIIEKGASVDFLTRQVLTSRNIYGRGMNMFMGGLNYQIEHHLFPDMPRPHLAKARIIVKEYCEKAGIKYTETSLLRSYGIVIQYLNRVGIAARDPFECPMVAQYRIH